MRTPEVKTPNWVFLMQGKNPEYIYAHVTKVGRKYHAKIVGRVTKAIMGYSEQSIEQQLRQLIETPAVK